MSTLMASFKVRDGACCKGWKESLILPRSEQHNLHQTPRPDVPTYVIMAPLLWEQQTVYSEFNVWATERHLTSAAVNLVKK